MRKRFEASKATPDENVKSKTKTPRPQIQRVTGAELEEKLAAWREARRNRQQQRPPDEVEGRRRGRVAVALGVALLATAATFGVVSHFQGQQQEANAAQLHDLQAQLSEAQAQPVPDDLGDRLVALSMAVKQDAAKVATEQQRFSELFRTASLQPTQNNGAPNEGTLATAEHRKDLAPYFDPESYVVKDDKEAYGWQPMPPFDESTEIDPRFPWYVRYDGSNAADPETYTWAVESATPTISAEARTAKVMWACRDKESGEPLAWAEATYTFDSAAGKGVFSDLSLITTSLGAQFQTPTIDHNQQEG